MKQRLAELKLKHNRLTFEKKQKEKIRSKREEGLSRIDILCPKCSKLWCFDHRLYNTCSFCLAPTNAQGMHICGCHIAAYKLDQEIYQTLCEIGRIYDQIGWPRIRDALTIDVNLAKLTGY